MGRIEIRRAVIEDIPVILTLLRELAAYERLPDRVEVDEARLQRYVFSAEACAEACIATLDGAPVGYALFFPIFASFRGLPWLFLEDLYVTQEARGHGVGRAFMTHLARLAIERGWAAMAWGVLDWNAPAFRFYDSLGATRIEGHVHMSLTGAALEKLAAGQL
jgi:GNAT superfamily N-acetyltransferase